MASKSDAGHPFQEIEQSATMGGQGWQERRLSVAEEVSHGVRWHRCGLSSEVAPLREVLLHLPGDEMRLSGLPNQYLMFALPDPRSLANEITAISAFYQAQGIAVQFARPPGTVPPNFLFQRDLFFMTPEGAVLGRPAAEVRAGEERFEAEVLARIGIPILLGLHGRATFEGADALWLDERTVLLGVGRRTNAEAQAQLAWLLMRMGVRLVSIPMPTGIQHLLGMVNFIDGDLAAIHPTKAPEELADVLKEQGVEALPLPLDEELVWRRSLNFVTLRPREVVMSEGCPVARGLLEARGVRVHELRVSELLKAAGGLGCTTGILSRG